MYDHFEQPGASVPLTLDAPLYISEADASVRPQVIWVGDQDGDAAREADPYDVINFLLKKIEEQQARLTEHEGFADLQNQEIEQIKGLLEAKRHELEITQADYDVVLQNGLAVERDLELARGRALELEAELEGLKVRVIERPRIQLPFHTEQKLAKLGYGDAEVVPEH